MGSSSDLGLSGYTLEEQNEIYKMSLQDVYDNPRWYLDNLESLKSFRVGWHNYHTVNTNIPVLREHMLLNCDENNE